jgi:hypothetical protein
MALETLTPLTYSAFIEKTENSIQGIIDYFNNEDHEFWLKTLKTYSFRGQNFQSGEKTRLEFNEDLSSCSGDEELNAVANRILEWGGMKPLSPNMRQELRPSLSLLKQLASGNVINISQLCVERLASITKVYEMYDLDNWIIYDSYCVRGLQWLISRYWKAIGFNKNEGLLKLPWPPGRSGFPIDGFPRAADTAPNQKRLGFIYGSWLCKGIAERLATNSDFCWQSYHLEMLAFQAGHIKG